MPGWIGVNNQPRKIKAIYIGINGQPKKVKAAWVGVNNRPKKWYEAATEVTQQSIKIAIDEDCQKSLLSGQGINGIIVNDSGNMTPHMDGSTLITKNYIQTISVGYGSDGKPGTAQIVLGTPQSGWTQRVSIEYSNLPGVSGKPSGIKIMIVTDSESYSMSLTKATTRIISVEGPITEIQLKKLEIGPPGIPSIPSIDP